MSLNSHKYLKEFWTTDSLFDMVHYNYTKYTQYFYINLLPVVTVHVVLRASMCKVRPKVIYRIMLSHPRSREGSTLLHGYMVRSCGDGSGIKLHLEVDGVIFSKGRISQAWLWSKLGKSRGNTCDFGWQIYTVHLMSYQHTHLVKSVCSWSDNSAGMT